MLSLPTLTSVPGIVDTVNMQISERGYHHGNLRSALVDAGVELARAGGPGAVLLRSASRRAGVSHNAAYRHFANQEDFVAAVAEQCMSRIGQLMITRIDAVAMPDPVDHARAKLGALGRAYIEFARTEPGWFRTAFSAARPHSPGADGDRTTSPLVLLGARLDELAAVGGLAPERRPGAEYAAWSAVHGLSSLVLDGPLRDLSEPEIDKAMGVVFETLDRGLSSTDSVH
jgi:AcrR family transcriptional regulator